MLQKINSILLQNQSHNVAKLIDDIWKNYILYIYIYIGYKVKDFTTADRAQILIYQQGKYLPVPN